jgi:hypothetical protein
MATIVIPNSRILFNNTPFVFSFPSPSNLPMVLDLEILGGTGAVGDTMTMQFIVNNGRLVHSMQINRWTNHFAIIPDRRMVVVPQSALLFSNIVVIQPVSSNPSDFFFIGPVVVQG